MSTAFESEGRLVCSLQKCVSFICVFGTGSCDGLAAPTCSKTGLLSSSTELGLGFGDETPGANNVKEGVDPTDVSTGTTSGRLA